METELAKIIGSNVAEVIGEFEKALDADCETSWPIDLEQSVRRMFFNMDQIHRTVFYQYWMDSNTNDFSPLGVPPLHDSNWAKNSVAGKCYTQIVHRLMDVFTDNPDSFSDATKWFAFGQLFLIDIEQNKKNLNEQELLDAEIPSDAIEQNLKSLLAAPKECRLEIRGLKADLINLRRELSPRPYLDVTYESGIVEREGYSNQADLNGAKEGRTLFEIALKAVGNPTKRDEMIAMVYQGKERTNSAIIGVRSTLNAKLEKLNLEVDKEFCLRNFRSEK